MSAPDRTGIEATGADVVEQDSPDGTAVPDVDVPLEAVDADVVEQATDAGPGERPAPGDAPRDVPLEADAADAAEQSTEVELDEDERR